jgi:hypothetical protein
MANLDINTWFIKMDEGSGGRTEETFNLSKLVLNLSLQHRNWSNS